MPSICWRRLFPGVPTLLVGLLMVATPFWRHRVLVHRPPFDVYFALLDVIAYTSDYVTVLVIVVGWISLFLVRRPVRRLSTGPWFVFGPLCVLTALSAASVSWAVDPVYAGYQATRYLLWMALYLLLVNLDVVTDWLAASVVVGILVQALVGLGQVMVGQSLGLGWLGELPLNPEWAGVSVVFTESGRHLRAYGLTQHPNLLGGMITGLLLLLVGYAVQRVRYLPVVVSGALYLVFALGTATLLMTFSRGAWLAALIGATSILGLLLRAARGEWAGVFRSLTPAMVVVAAVGLIFAVTQWELLRPRLGLTYQGGEVRSVDERATLMAGARVLRDLRPWLGVGAGGFSRALYELAPEAIADYPIFQPVHSVPLLVAVELGPLASAVWMFVMLAPLGALLLTPAGRALDGWLAALTAVPVTLFVVGWVEAYPWSSQQGALLTWIALGLWAGEYRRLLS